MRWKTGVPDLSPALGNQVMLSTKAVVVVRSMIIAKKYIDIEPETV